MTKRRRDLGAAAARRVADIGEAMDRPMEKGAGEFLHIAIDEIRPDPENPRWENRQQVTLEDMRDFNKLNDEKVRTEAELIVKLSETIDSAGLLQPLVVYRDGGIFRLVDGERRFLALQYLGRTHTEAKILRDPPRRKKLTQMVANVQRADLPTPQLLSNIEHILEEARALGDQINTATEFSRYVGLSNSSGQRWWAILNGPKDVVDALRDGTIPSFRKAYEISTEMNATERARLISEASGSTETTRKPPKPGKPSKPTKNPKRITLGTAPADVVKFLLEAHDPESTRGIKWDDPIAVKRVFKRFIKTLEKQLKDAEGN